MIELWDELIEALTLLKKGANPNSYPTHCEHDELTVCADPSMFTAAELDRLRELGFSSYDGESFQSFKFGSA